MVSGSVGQPSTARRVKYLNSGMVKPARLPQSRQIPFPTPPHPSVKPLPFSAESTLPAPVLVVEDEPLIRQRLRDVLLGLGYTPEVLTLLKRWRRRAPASREGRWRWRWSTWACRTAAGSI